MNKISYVDASALVKRYVDEIGSNWMKAYCSDAEQSIFMADVGRAEVISAFAGKLRGNFISQETFNAILADFIGDVQSDYEMMAATSSIVDEAMLLIQNYKLRGYDAIHIACAVHIEKALQRRGLPSLTLVAADNDLLKAAQAIGLTTENPNHHP